MIVDELTAMQRKAFLIYLEVACRMVAMVAMKSGPICIDDFEQYARYKLPKSIYDYYKNGADDEITLKRNVEAFKRLLIRPRFMRDVSNVDTSVDLLGGKFHLNFPICLAPTASQRMAHPDGEMATSRASADMGTIMVASTIATTSLENIAKAAPDGLRWFQLYVYKDRKATEAIVRRVEKAGYKALVVTIDTAVAGNRRNDARNSFALPSHLRMENFVDDLAAGLTMNVAHGSTSGFTNYVNSFFDSSMTWSTIDWLKSITSLPVMVKGLLTAEDAELACQHGVEGIIVSNHGARQCDSVPATVEALPEVVQAVDNRCDVYIDGGIRSGNDVFKALALGAKVVFVGRPYLWGLAYDGEAGVKSVINVLKTELQTTMALAGCKNMHDVQTIKKLVVHESNYASLISKL